MKWLLVFITKQLRIINVISQLNANYKIVTNKAAETIKISLYLELKRIPTYILNNLPGYYFQRYT